MMTMVLTMFVMIISIMTEPTLCRGRLQTCLHTL
jgi:hypothetical protein